MNQPADTQSVQSEISAMKPWFHNLHLPNGIETAPDHFLGDFPAFKWTEIAPYIPADLKGWRVLDIGCNAGFYSFELAKRGADVLGIDLDPHYLQQARWAAGQLGLENRVAFRQMQVYDLSKREESFDLIWFMGVFYHLRYPLLALDIIAQKVKQLLVFQTLTMPGTDVLEVSPDYTLNDRESMREPGWPKMAFIEKQLNSDPTNWWAPNHAAIEAMLRTCGLKVSERPGHETYICTPDPDNPPVAAGWNRSEYLSATGADWQQATEEKLRK
jgi:tRNA (mo5U34)-methyltransferase